MVQKKEYTMAITTMSSNFCVGISSELYNDSKVSHGKTKVHINQSSGEVSTINYTYIRFSHQDGDVRIFVCLLTLLPMATALTFLHSFLPPHALIVPLHLTTQYTTFKSHSANDDTAVKRHCFPKWSNNNY